MKVLYHDNCTDGKGAALAAWMRLGDRDLDGKKIEYLPVQYGNQPPNITAGEEIVMVDFSYPREAILDMALIAGKITIIDHHKTAQAALSAPFPRQFDTEPLCEVECIFDMEKSGAVLAWEYFYPDSDIPELLQHIQDRDLWRFELPRTKEIHKGLSLYADFREWEDLILYPNKLREVAAEGAAIDAYLEAQSKKIIETPPMLWPLEMAVVPVYNLMGFMISETLHLALEKYPEAPYAVNYFDIPDEGKRVYSLRSRRGTDVDVSEIAKKYGGGGHKHAAGFALEI